MPSKEHEEIVDRYISIGYHRHGARKAFITAISSVFDDFDAEEEELGPLPFVPDAYRVVTEERNGKYWTVLDCIEVEIENFPKSKIERYVYYWFALDGTEYPIDIRLTHVSRYGSETRIDLSDEYLKALAHTRRSNETDTR